MKTKLALITSSLTVFDSAADARFQIFPIAAILIFYLASMAEISMASWIARRNHGRR